MDPVSIPDFDPAELMAILTREEGERALDEIGERLITGYEPVSAPLRHIFTPGIYLREIFMPAGSKVLSREHLTEHPFIILAGVVSVWSPLEPKWRLYRGPFHGVTKPGTRRLLYCHTDVVWLTAHANPQDIRDPDQIVLNITRSDGKYANLGPAAHDAPAIHPQPQLQGA